MFSFLCNKLNKFDGKDVINIADFSSLSALEKHLNTCLQNVLENEVFTAISKEIQTSVVTDVYDNYKPTQYDRTGKMATSQVIKKYKINGIGIEISHERMDGSKNISEAIENGFYTWKHSGIAMRTNPARPFMKNTLYRILKGNIHIKALKLGMKRFGIEVV